LLPGKPSHERQRNKFLIANSQETSQTVKAWLIESGIDEDRITLAQGLGWFHFDATVEEAEQLLRTKYHLFGHLSSGKPHVACDEYSVPEHVSEHIDFITPTIHFDSKVHNLPGGASVNKRDSSSSEDRLNVGHRVGWSKVNLPKISSKLESLPMALNTTKKNNKASTQAAQADLSDCVNSIVPDCLRALYDFEENTDAVEGNSYGVVEYTPQVKLQTPSIELRAWANSRHSLTSQAISKISLRLTTPLLSEVCPSSSPSMEVSSRM
jgi:tripeptidyl-peptidase I